MGCQLARHSEQDFAQLGLHVPSRKREMGEAEDLLDPI